MAQDLQDDVENVSRIEAVPTILEVVRRTSGMRFIVVARVTEDRWIACSVLDEIDFGLRPGAELPVETTICHIIRRSRKPVIINNVAEDDFWREHAIPRMYGFQSYIAVPIILTDGSVFGTLCAVDPRPTQLENPEIIGMFQLFAELIAKHLDTYRKLAVTESALLEKHVVSARQEKALSISEARYRAVVKTQNEMVCRYLPDATLTFVNDAYCRYFGKSRDNLIGRSFFELLSEPEQVRARELISATLEGRHSGPTEHADLQRDGSIRWAQWVNHVIREGDSIEIQGIGWEITQQKRAEEALERSREELRGSHAQIRQLTARLMKAQEQERRHIARELHDDLNQQMAGISISLGNIKRQLPPTDSLAHQLGQVQECVKQIASGIRRLSHELHPVMLEHSLTTALQSITTEFNSTQEVKFHFHVPEHLRPVPDDVAVCIFRVAQESLQNISKHSGAHHAHIELAADGECLSLLITDDGCGFEIEKVRTRGGLGLLSMAERVHLMGGVFELRTNPGDGTFLRATVPLTSH